MIWKDCFDDKSIIEQNDKYGRTFCRGNIVAWATHKRNTPVLLDGTVIGFSRSPSFIDTYIKTKNNRIVRKNSNLLIKI